MIYIFDESDASFRYPGEAIEAPGTLTLCMKLRRGQALNPKIHVYPDGGTALEIKMNFDCVTGVYDQYKASINFQKPGLYWYHFSVNTTSGGYFTVPEYSGGGFQVTVYSSEHKTPQWLAGGIIYHIFVDRFFPGGSEPARSGSITRTDWGGCPYFLPDERGIVKNNDFFGGDLQGIVQKLPYLESLGVNCIYLSPVFEAVSNHKYDTGDFLKVDRTFGGDEALALLCTEARKCGIRVILDGVFNHVGSDSLYFNRYGHYDSIGAYQSVNSPYRNWFTIREDGSYESWWGIELLPAINEHDESYRQFICGEDGVVAHWMKRGVSGWRLDVVDELPDDFLYPLCNTVREIDPEAYIVGEVWEDASHKIAYGVRRRYFLDGQLDSVTNYPLRSSIIACVREGNVEQLADTMATLCRNYPKPVLDVLMNILGTHDTMRILTVLGGSDFPDSKVAMSHYKLHDDEIILAKNRLMLASMLQYTLPGVPCVYYADETGMEGGADPFNRRCYPWGSEDMQLVDWYKRLARLRSENSCFIDGAYKLVEARAGIFAFTRGSGADCVLVAVNVSDEDKILSMQGFNYDLLNENYINVLTVKSGTPGMFAIRPES